VRPIIRRIFAALAAEEEGGVVVPITYVPPVADFTALYEAPVVVGESIQFTDTSTGPPKTWSWSFGDGEVSVERDPTHTYAAPGTYTVSLTVTNDLGEDTVVKTDFVTVIAVFARFSASTLIGTVPVTVNFTDQSEGVIESWLWDFGDGETSFEQNPVHTYEVPGAYHVTLTVTNPHGSDTSDPGECIIQVLKHDLEWVLATDTPPWGAREAPHVVTFKNKIWVIGGDNSSSWGGLGDFGDVWNSSDGVNWTLVTSSPPWAGTYGYGVLVFKDKLWVLCGGTSSDVWCSDDGADWFLVTHDAPWRGPLSDPSMTRHQFGVAVFNDMMWVLGGHYAPQYYPRSIDDVWCSSDGVNWYLAVEHASWGTSKEGLAEMAVTLFDDKLWVIGGRYAESFSYYIRKGVWYSHDGSAWTVTQGDWLNPWGGRYSFPAISFNGKIWIFGGKDGANDIWRSSNGVSWSRATITPADWTAPINAGVALHNGKLWMVGGLKGGTYSREVWYAVVGDVDDKSPPISVGHSLFRSIGARVPGGTVLGKGPRKRR